MSSAHEHVGDLGEGPALVSRRGRVRHHDRPTRRLCEERMLRIESEARRDHRDAGLLGQPVRAPPRGIRLVDPQPAVPLDPHRAGADDHDVGERAEHLHRQPVARVAEPAAAPLDRDGAVEAHHEVHPHARCRAVVDRVRREESFAVDVGR